MTQFFAPDLRTFGHTPQTKHPALTGNTHAAGLAVEPAADIAP